MTTHDLSYISPDLRPLAIPIAELDLMEQNPRRHNRQGQAALKLSLKQFGQVKPVVLGHDGRTVIAGNGTLDAARELGWTHLAVVRSGFEDGKAAAYSIADNRTTDLSAFDADIVDAIMSGLDEDLRNATGFIDDILASFDDPATDASVGPPETVPPGTSIEGGMQRAPEAPADLGGSTTAASRNMATYRYTMAFETLEDQEAFYGWLRDLKSRYPEPGHQTAVDRVLAYIREHPIDA